MLSFACHCGHKFDLADDEAGGLIQCPQCHRLNDVPTLGDLAHLDADGTFKIDASPLAAEHDRMRKLREAFAPTHLDDDGDEIDLRPSFDDVRRAGAPPDLESRKPLPSRPKYDPATGELLAELPIIPSPPPQAPPKPRTLNYAKPRSARAENPWGALVELLMPVNAVVMFFVFLAYFLAQMASYSLVMWIGALGIIALMLAHYAVVVEEIGPEERDELPRPLRNVSLSDDVWRPLCNALGALMLSFAPAILIRMYAGPGQLAAIAVLIATVGGMIVFPATLLTLVASGAALSNLRPDRVIGLIRAAAPAYALATATWFVAAILTVWNTLGLALIDPLTQTHAWLWKLNHPAVVYPLIAVSIYLMHWFCWQLGLIHRHHHAEFPWVLQRHIPLNRLATLPDQARAARPPK